MYVVQPFWKTVWKFLTSHAITIRPSNYTLGVFIQINEILCSHKILCITTLSVTAKNWSQHRCPPTGRIICTTEQLGNKKEYAIDSWNNFDSPENYTK